jgi:hypothetical protein
MVNSKVLVIYLFFLVFFSFIYSGITSDSSNNFNAKDYLVVSKIRDALGKTDNWLTDIFRVVLIPFILIDILVFIIAMVGFSFVQIPFYIDVLILTPLGIIVMFDYILPYLRGN